MRLDAHEYEHLRQLVAQRPRTQRRPAPEKLDLAARDLLRAFGTTLALVLGRRTDVLAWNPLGYALPAGRIDRTAPDRPADRPNPARRSELLRWTLPAMEPDRPRLAARPRTPRTHWFRRVR
ncbi:hypothetical protein AB0H42_23270 [Nocardia sp. NPDC050799]|uniref:MmyB family transcriptional regulator n=1 Tax=Nocardia sp. NPDC050799 TaxID=3154842 RepID=UPI00341116A0